MGQTAKPLTREGFLKRAVVKEVPLSDGSAVCIRALPASFFVSDAKENEDIFGTANMLVQSLCDQDGKLLFTDEEKDLAMTIDHVGLKSIMDAIMDLNGLGTGKDAGSIEKN